MGDKTKIDWADATWNPVTGCFHNCPYCYARGIAHRYGLPYAPSLGDPGMEGAAKWDSDEGMDTMLELEKPYIKDGKKQPYPMGFYPTFHRYRLNIPARWERPRTIFVCSMADLFGDWVPDEWIREVFDACATAPQHRYLFLTKNPARYSQLVKNGIVMPNTIEWWYGYTVDGLRELPDHRPIGWHSFVSVEPLLRAPDAKMLEDIAKTSWIIVGAETGNRKGKVIPEKAWIDQIVHKAQSAWMTPVFMKESLREIMGRDFRQEFPWEA